jgi:hypothetical protein
MANIINGTDTGSGGLITTGDSSDELQIQTAETTALTITSGQQSVFIAGTAAAPAVTTTGDLNTGIFFSAADTLVVTTGGTAAVTVDSGQRTKFPTTIGVGGATPSASGSGISFPATQSASSDANTLDDYEEGTWTPTLTFTGGGSVSYTTQLGTYVKIGRMVHCNVAISLSGTSSPTGNVGLSGLPFTNTGGGQFSSGASKAVIRSLSSSNAFILINVDAGATTMSFNSNATNLGASFLQGTEMLSSTLMFFSFTYQPAA